MAGTAAAPGELIVAFRPGVCVHCANLVGASHPQSRGYTFSLEEACGRATATPPNVRASN
jgi:hypothetical protein